MNVTYSLKSFFDTLDGFAPLSLSKKMMEKGDYDNSGILIKTHDYVKKVIFSLDLSDASLKRAKRVGADTVVTHHPAIYTPLGTLDTDSLESGLVTKAVNMGLNVISMHLNLDVADGGIDQSLAEGLGATRYALLENVTEKHGYGRVFNVKPQTLKDFVSQIKITFDTKKIIVYGSKTHKIDTVASFCGGGASHALDFISNADIKPSVIVTSDTSHHHVKGILESGSSLVVIPHYVSEEFGFRKYYEKIKNQLLSNVEFEYFDDRRFR